MKRLIIIGASGHGKVIADIARLNGYSNIVFLDDDDSVKECSGFPVIGKTSEAGTLDGDKIVAIGNPDIRERIQKDISTIILLHPDAVIGNNVSIGEGTVVMAGVVINPDTKIGKGCIINTASSVDHDCMIEDYVHVAVGAHICVGVRIGRKTWIGAGVIVNNYHNVCGECLIGSGAVVVKDIKEAGTYVGTPATKMERTKSKECGKIAALDTQGG